MKCATIRTKTFRNRFTRTNFYIITVDNKSLEDIILEKQPKILKGLVPTLLNWLQDEEERAVVWERTLPSKPWKKTLLPILMCSEDIDLWCTLIMTEVSMDEQFVYWNRFGLEVSNAEEPKEIGKKIEWFDNIEGFKFELSEYQQLLEKFRQNLDVELKKLYLADEVEIVSDYL